MQLREYQKELIKDVLRGYNALICAPTGSGKTIVAAAFIKEHFLSNKKLNKKVKVYKINFNIFKKIYAKA